MRESRKRTFVKTISWRAIATIVSFIVAYIVSNDLTIASSIASMQVLIHTLLYYIHERVCCKMLWGNL